MNDPVTTDRFDAVLLDLDGVLTSTARVHAACWKKMFDEYLERRSQALADEFIPFDIQADYLAFVDGRPRYDGVRTFLSSRGIRLPEGRDDDPPELETIRRLSDRKNELVKLAIERDGVEVYAGSIAWVRQLRERGIRRAVVTSSKNCDRVLAAAGIEDLFEARVDGNVVEELGLAGKPAPDTFLRGAALLGARPSRTVIVEDAMAGVQAGAAGEFGLVIGVARHGNADELRANGAGVVVADLGEFLN